MDVSTSIAASLLEVGAVRIQPEQPFTWSSGWKAPIYCDNRLTLSYPSIRSTIKQELAKLVQAHFPQATVIAGVATAGIPQGALVADVLGLPYIYVRNKPKGHGMTNQIEGEVPDGSSVVLVEDLISTGGSSIQAAEACRREGLKPLGIVSIFTYGFPVAEENMAKAQLESYSLSNYTDLLRYGLDRGIIAGNQKNRLQEWRQSPATWS